MDKLRFLHIPKTAGSTFLRILRNKNKGRAQFIFTGDNPSDIKRFLGLSTTERKAVTLFAGHAPIISGVREADEIPIITVLRDPVKRVKSFCQYVSEGKSNKYLLEKYPPETFDLDEFLCSGYSELSNLQSRMLINYEKKGSDLLCETLAPEQIKEKALDNLFNKVTCYGLQEYFDESLLLFSTQFGWGSPYYEYMNRKGKKKLLKFGSHHIKIIQELNKIDIEFYAVAKSRFVSLVGSDDSYRSKCERFKRNQKIISRVLKCYGSAGRYAKKKYRSVFKDK